MDTSTVVIHCQRVEWGVHEWRLLRTVHAFDLTAVVTNAVAVQMLNDFGVLRRDPLTRAYPCTNGAQLAVDWSTVTGVEATNDLTYANGS